MSRNEQDSWEDDSVWKLLDQSEPPKASPAFKQDVMRRLRLSEDESPTPWWKKILSPAPLSVGLLGAAAAVTLMVILQEEPPISNPGSVAENTVTPPSEPTSLDQAINEELLMVAVEEPELFSDAELFAMLY